MTDCATDSQGRLDVAQEGYGGTVSISEKGVIKWLASESTHTGQWVCIEIIFFLK